MTRREGTGRNTAGSKPERDRLRRTMREQGFTTEQIAMAMLSKWHYRPRQAWRYANDLTQDEVAQRYNQLIDDPGAPMSSKRIADYEAWPFGGAKPTLTVLRNLATVFGTVEWKLVDFDDLDWLNSHERAALKPPGEDEPAGEARSTQRGQPSGIHPVTRPSLVLATNRTLNAEPHAPRRDRPWALSDIVMAAAHQSREHAEGAQGHIMPATTLEELTAEVERLTRERLHADPLVIFADTVQLRDEIYRFLEQRQYPDQTRHLYYLASVTCCLLANSSDAFGFPRASVEQARAAWAYAEIIGHNSLRLFAKVMQAAVAFRDNRPQRALDLARSATRWATEPIAQAYLYSAIARYSGRALRPDESRAAVRTALDAFDSATGDSELFDHLGGMFGYPRAKLLYESNTAYLQLGDLGPAQEAINEAIQLYEGMPVESRAFDREAAARIGVGHTRLLAGEAEGAEEALRLVFTLPPPRRLKWVVSRMHDFGAALASHGAATSALGRQLGQAIEEFTETNASSSAPNPYG
ncbi:MAG TPA: hypothetical protein VGX25_20490 [Actinophytocola sp.]|uniref:hypothetical protein n=1 Tax=Actinophytocola sp. TaxID=1872138 RepID=UPI002DDD3909|nr:hypothetical protein [Actinophytocola sp.]HEV2781771.1 hypothetical protein [Actinophytocola sp.]